MITEIIEHQLQNVAKNSQKCFVRDFQTTINEFRQMIFDDFKGVFSISLSGYTFSFSY
jgi:hypothetical protein